MMIIMELKIPDYWTPEQATAVIEFIEDVEAAIRKKYQSQIMAQQLSDLCHEEELNDLEDPDFLPF